MTGTADCLNLRQVARERRWRWRFEGSHRAEHDPATRGDGRWYVEILCRRGLIYPFGGDDLLAYVSGRGVLPKLLALSPEVSIYQGGHREAVVRFPSALLDAVAPVLRPKRIGGRPATEEDRGRLARTAFRPALPRPFPGAGTTQRAPDGPGAVHGPSDTK